MVKLEMTEQNFIVERRIEKIEPFIKKFLEPMYDKVIRTDSYVKGDKEYLSHNYPEILKLTSKRNGLPDIICLNDHRILFIELKKHTDSLRFNQSKWVREHPQYRTIILFVNQYIEDEIIKEVKCKMEQQIKELKQEFKEKEFKMETLLEKSKTMRKEFNTWLEEFERRTKDKDVLVAIKRYKEDMK